MTLGVLNINRGAQYGFISANIDSDNYLLLMAVITDNITDNFTFFLYFSKFMHLLGCCIYIVHP